MQILWEALRGVQTDQCIAKFTGGLGPGVGVQQKETLKHLPKLPRYCSWKSSLPIANAVGRVSAYVCAAG